MKKPRNIFETFQSKPIKNVKTPIRKFNGEETGDVEDDYPIYTRPNGSYRFSDIPYEATLTDVYDILSQVKVLLLVLIALKLYCLIKK